MNWRWEVDDLNLRITFARMRSPTDIFTSLARILVTYITAAMGLLLNPVDIVIRATTRISLKLPFVFVVILLLLMLLDIIWLAIWGLLVGSSWLWIKYSWLRPILIFPGMLIAILAHFSIMIAPDPQKNPRYTTLPQEWPLTWHIWRPPEDYRSANKQT